MPVQKPWVRLSLSESASADSQRLLQIFSAPQVSGDRVRTEATANFNEAFNVAIPIGNIEIPDLSDFPTAHQKAEHLLGLAAGIEHALLVQYLYAGYSANGSGSVETARNNLLEIAVEEMSHLMSVQNLLLLIGANPTVRRSDRQDITVDPIVPIDLMFEKLSKTALAKYIVAESPADAAVVEPLYPFITSLAGTAHASMIKKVGLLYALLGVVIGDEAVLNHRAASAGAMNWDLTVKALADAIAADPSANAAYGGRAGMHLADSDFQSGSSNPFLSRQGTDIAWDRSTRDSDFRVFAPTDRNAALDTLRDISIQGEAPSSTSSSAKSHFARFVATFKTLYGLDGTGPEPTSGVSAVPTGAVIVVQATDGDASTISNVAARPRAQLAELRYWILLGALDQYLHSPPDDRDFLVAWCITEMYQLKKISTILLGHPRTAAGIGAAAIPFGLPPKLPSEIPIDLSGVNGPRTPWPGMLKDAFTESIALATSLLADTQSDSEKQLLRYMIEVDGRKLLESMMRQSGNSGRTSFDHVREILEWAAGAGDPNHEDFARFWNQPITEFKSTVVYGQTVIGTTSANSGLVAVLQSGQMPADRGKLNTPDHQSKIDAVKLWIDEGAKPDDPIKASGSIREIKEIRLLPSLALARLGSSPQPMQNYVLEIDNGQSYRQIRPAETLVVNEQNGTIAGAIVPADVKFKDAMGRVKPVCPFIEVWAIFDDNDELRPLTTRELTMLSLEPSALKWTVRVANLKAFRRTGQVGDRIEASVTGFSDHDVHSLLGRGPNLRTSRSISFGAVRFVRPTDEFPEIRLRFTPAAGKVFGHRVDANISADRNVYDPTNGTWDNHNDGGANPAAPTPRARLSTAPGGIYATTPPPQRRNLGYLDDSCDGIVSLVLNVNGRELSAHARVASGPPDYAPDSLPVRAVADDLEQVLEGPDVANVTADEVIEIVRRAFETVRAIGLTDQNASFPFWQPAAQEPFGPNLNYAATVGIHRQLLESLGGLHAPANAPERTVAHQSLIRIAGAVRPWDEAANYSNPGTTQSPGMRQMPGLMRGADGELLALTRRQRAKLLLAVDAFRPAPLTGDTPRSAMVLMIESLNFGAFFHGGILTASGVPLSNVFANPDMVLTHLETGVVQGSLSPAIPFRGQPLIIRGNPDASPFLLIVSNSAHRMNRELTGLNGYRDPNTNKDGLIVIREWIASLI